MAEERAPGKVGGWIKAGITSIMGLCSGAVLMYVSPLVTNAIKPGKPLANFGHQVQGLAVTFQNRATGATEGWWDFGDGSPLEPFSAAQETLTHVFPHASNYTVKLSLRNFIGDETERTVAVSLDAKTAGTPVIESFKVIPIKTDAPATFRIVSQVKNADECIWCLGDDRELEITSETSNPERYVTIADPGPYTLRLVARSGTKSVQKSEAVFVGVGNNAAALATLQVSYKAVHIERRVKEANLQVSFPADRKEQTFPINLTQREADYQIADAKFARPVKESFVKNPALDISADKSKVVLTGELVRPGGLMAWQKAPKPLTWTPTLVLSLERRAEPVVKTPDPIAAVLNVGGTTLIPIPKLSKHWEIQKTTLSLELSDGPFAVYKDSKLPAGALVQFKNHPYRLTAIQEADHVRLDLIDAKATLRPVTN